MYDIISYEVHNFLSYIYIYQNIHVRKLYQCHTFHQYTVYQFIMHNHIKKYFLMHIEKKTTQKRRGGVITR